MKMTITKKKIGGFSQHLVEKELSESTTQKYVREIERLADYIGHKKITKPILLSYRKKLQETNKAQTVNGKVGAINAFLSYAGLSGLEMKYLRVQHRSFIDDDRELSNEEYKKLLSTAKAEKNERLYHIMLTIGNTGIRISELKYITVEGVRKGRIEIYMKAKQRLILIPKELRRQLLLYVRDNKIKSGSIFVTRNGIPLDRSNICHEMKAISRKANVEETKVFPHNLRHLFARCFYEVEKKSGTSRRYPWTQQCRDNADICSYKCTAMRANNGTYAAYCLDGL